MCCVFVVRRASFSHVSLFEDWLNGRKGRMVCCHAVVAAFGFISVESFTVVSLGLVVRD